MSQTLDFSDITITSLETETRVWGTFLMHVATQYVIQDFYHYESETNSLVAETIWNRVSVKIFDPDNDN